MNVIYQSFHPSHDLFHLQGDFKMGFSEKNYTMSTWNDNFVSLKATWFDFTGKKKNTWYILMKVSIKGSSSSSNRLSHIF